MKNLLRVGGSVILVAVIAYNLDWTGVGGAFARLDLRWWVAAVALYTGVQALSSYRWSLLAGLQGFGGPRRRYFAYYLVGMFFNLVLPTSVGGDVVRAWYLGRQREAPAARARVAAVLSVLSDRVNGVLMLVALACGAAALSPGELPGWILGAVAGVGGCAAGGVAVLLLADRVLARRPDWASNRWSGKLRGLARATVMCSNRPGLFARVTALSFVVQVGNVLLFWLVGRGLGLPVGLVSWCVVVPLVTLVTLLPSINGMGLREAALVVLLGPLGVAQADAVAVSVLAFSAVGAVSLAGLPVYLLGNFPRFSAREASTEGRGDEDTVRRDPDQGREGQFKAAA